MPQVQLVRIMIPAGSPVAFVFGRLVDDPTKVAVAAMLVEGALQLSAEAHRAEGLLDLDFPDDTVLDVLELPE